MDNGKEKEEEEEVLLNSPNKGLIIYEMIWREIYEFSENCVLLVLASEYSLEEDYIRNYNEFIETLRV